VSAGAGGAQKGAGACGWASCPRIPVTGVSARADPRRARGGWSRQGRPTTQRERTGARGQRNRRRQLGPTGSDWERGECGAVWRRQAGSACQGWQARGHGRATGPGGLVWAELAFSISLSLGFFISNSN
jgi:hypothetical protein